MQAECSQQPTAVLPAAQSCRLRPLYKKLDPDDRNAMEQHSIFVRAWSRQRIAGNPTGVLGQLEGFALNHTVLVR